MQKDRRWTDDTTELLSEAKRAVRDAWEDLRRLRACNEASKLMIRQSQRLIAEISGGVHYEVIECAPAIIPPTPRNTGRTWPEKHVSSELLLAEARHVRTRVTQAYQSCLRVTESFTETREKTRRLIHEATAALGWDVGWRL